MATISYEQDRLEITWADGARDAFHYLWLRDNCPCAQCLDPDAGERLFDTVSMPPDLAPRQVKADGEVIIDWEDGHRTVLDAAWLRDNAYGPSARRTRAEAPQLWDASIASAPPEISLSEIDSSDEGLARWLRLIRDYGFAIVRGVPTHPEAVVALAERVAFVQESNFGRTFEVVSKPDPNNLAFTSHRLFSHTDIPNRHSAINLQLLHCLENSAEGGESILIDGFEAARRLADEDPRAHELLSSVAVPWRFHDSGTDIRNRFPVIGVDGDGRHVEIRFHTALMAPMDIDPELVVPFYEALATFGRILRDPNLEYHFRMGPGDCQIFDNQRVLHARGAFDPSTGRRHLQGCYLDKDDAMGRLRSLERAAAGLQRV